MTARRHPGTSLRLLRRERWRAQDAAYPGAPRYGWVHAGGPKHLPPQRHLSNMQAEGDVVRLPVAQEGPLDFATFFADEHRELFRFLCFVTGNRADAADLMQDAFLKLWERWDRIDRIADPKGYLFRVALNG